MELGSAGHSAGGPACSEQLLQGKGEQPPPAHCIGRDTGSSMGTGWVYIQHKLFPLFLLDGVKILVYFFSLYAQQCILLLLGRRGLVEDTCTSKGKKDRKIVGCSGTCPGAQKTPGKQCTDTFVLMTAWHLVFSQTFSMPVQKHIFCCL